jgi:uncharacterized protein
MSMEEMDGFFCALISGPVIVPPAQFLPELFGDVLSDVALSSSVDEFNEILALLLKHWNSINGEFGGGRTHEPLFSVEEKGRGREWARGFMAGVRMRQDSWSDLLQTHSPNFLFPMQWFAQEDDPASPATPLAGKTRDDLLAMLQPATLAIYRYYAPQRTANAGEETAHSNLDEPMALEE